MGLTANVYNNLEGEPDKLHQYFKNLRDKHIAHSVNPFEQVIAGVTLSHPADVEKKVEAVATLCSSLVSFVLDDLKQFLKLVIHAKNYVGQLARDAQDNLLKHARRQSISDLYNCPSL